MYDGYSYWLHSYSTNSQCAQETASCLRRILPPLPSQEEPSQTVQRSSSKHDTNTPHRSGTNGIADRAVRRVEGRATVSAQSGSPDEVVGLCDGMLVLLAQRPCQHGRGQDGTRERLLESGEKRFCCQKHGVEQYVCGFTEEPHKSPILHDPTRSAPKNGPGN